MSDTWLVRIVDPRGVTRTHAVTPEVADLLPGVLAMRHAYDALDYVRDFGDDGPTCGCGGRHWTCPGNDNPDDEETTPQEGVTRI